MKIVTIPNPSRISRAASRFLSTALVLSLSTPGICAASTPADSAAPAGSDASKPYTLFMGADFTVMWEGQLRPVEDVQGNAFVVSVDGKTVLVPSRLTDLQIKVDSALKLTPNSASISKFQAERAYTRGRDPADKIDEAIALYELADAAVDVADQTLRANETIQGLQAAIDGKPVPDLTAGAEGQAIQTASMAQLSPGSSIADSSARAGAQGLQEQFDAIRLSFVITSPKPLTNPYAVAVIRYRIEAQQPESSRVWVYALALSRVDAVPRKVSFARGGFPPGYALEDVQIHVYGQGGEVATTVSPKRVELSADEAFQYSVVEYVADKRDKTIGPVPARAFWPADLRARIQSSKGTGAIYVKVSKDGNPTGVFDDAACTKKSADAQLAAVISELRFYPALNKGKPAPGTVTLELSRLDN